MAGVAGDPTDVLDWPEAGGSVVRGGALRAGGYVLGTLVSLAGLALLTRHLGLEEFGRFSVIVALITVVGALTDAGMGTLGLREFSQRRGGDRDELMRTLLGLRLALTVLGAGIAALMALALGYRPALVLGSALAGVGLVLTVGQTTLGIPLAASLRNGALAGVDLLRQVLTVAAYGALVLAGAGTAAFLAVPIPVGIVLLVLVALLVRGQVPLRPRVAPRAWAALLRTSIGFALATAVGTIYVYTAQILTEFVASDQEVGLFAAAFRVFVVLGGVPGLLITVAFPVLARAARDDRERLAYGVGKLVDVCVLLGLGAAVALITGAPAIIAVMAGPEFAGAAGVLRIQSIAVVMSFVLATWGFALLSLHDHRALLRANALAFGVSAVAVTLLASRYGAEGAAFGTVLGEMVLAAGYAVGLSRGRPGLRPRSGVAVKALAVALPAVGLVFALGLPAVPAAVVALALYALGILGLRAVPQELLELLPGRR